MRTWLLALAVVIVGAGTAPALTRHRCERLCRRAARRCAITPSRRCSKPIYQTCAALMGRDCGLATVATPPTTTSTTLESTVSTTTTTSITTTSTTTSTIGGTCGFYDFPCGDLPSTAGAFVFQATCTSSDPSVPCGCGCVPDPSAPITSAVTLDNRTTDGFISGAFLGFENLALPPVGIYGYYDAFIGDFNYEGYLAAAESCDQVTGCCADIRFELSLFGEGDVFGQIRNAAAGCYDNSLTGWLIRQK
jgi:hypothetical protein